MKSSLPIRLLINPVTAAAYVMFLAAMTSPIMSNPSLIVPSLSSLVTGTSRKHTSLTAKYKKLLIFPIYLQNVVWLGS